MEPHLSYKALADHAAPAAGIKPAQARTVVEAVFDAIANAMKSGTPVTLSGFGTFWAPVRPGRTMRNLYTKEMMEVPAKRVPKFKPMPALKKHVAG